MPRVAPPPRGPLWLGAAGGFSHSDLRRIHWIDPGQRDAVFQMLGQRFGVVPSPTVND